MLINYYKFIFILIIILYSNLLFACNQQNTSNENEIYEYAKKYENIKNLDCNTNTLKIMQEVVKILKNSVTLTNKRSKLIKECGEKCQNKINNLTKQIKDDQDNSLKLVKKYNTLNFDKVASIITMNTIYRGIETSCGRNSRALLYKHYFISKIKKIDISSHELRDRLTSIDKNVYRETLKDINSGLFKIQCSWETLNEQYFTIQSEYNK